ncbi:DsrE family protein [Flavobacteriaceae bacterium LMO-SS05]
MKTYLNIIAALVFSIAVFAQEHPVKIVFDVTSDNAKVHGSTMRHVKAMSQAYPDSKFEVVIYSGAIDMVLKGKSTVESDMEAFANNKNVSFVVCEGTMARDKVTAEQLVTGVTSVPDGILEIVKRQAEGWGYIKEAQ